MDVFEEKKNPSKAVFKIINYRKTIIFQAIIYFPGYFLQPN